MIDRNAINRVFANWQNSQFMKLHAGEMTAQEVRTVRAVVKVIAWEINQILLDLPQAPPVGQLGEKSDGR